MKHQLSLQYLKSMSTEFLQKVRNEVDVLLRERDLFKTDQEKGVHAAHCCADHGCKYGDENCPVVLGTTEQRFPCIVCDLQYGQS